LVAELLFEKELLTVVTATRDEIHDEESQKAGFLLIVAITKYCRDDLPQLASFLIAATRKNMEES